MHMEIQTTLHLHYLMQLQLMQLSITALEHLKQVSAAPVYLFRVALEALPPLLQTQWLSHRLYLRYQYKVAIILQVLLELIGNRAHRQQKTTGSE